MLFGGVTVNRVPSQYTTQFLAVAGSDEMNVIEKIADSQRLLSENNEIMFDNVKFT